MTWSKSLDSPWTLWLPTTSGATEMPHLAAASSWYVPDLFVAVCSQERKRWSLTAMAKTPAAKQLDYDALYNPRQSYPPTVVTPVHFP